MFYIGSEIVLPIYLNLASVSGVNAHVWFNDRVDVYHSDMLKYIWRTNMSVLLFARVNSLAKV